MTELHERIFETTADALFVAEVDTGEIVAANPAAAALVGRDREDVVGSHIFEFHADDERDRYEQLFSEFVEQEQVQRDGLHVQTDDGDQVPVEISGSVIEVDGRRLLQGTFRDVSHRRELEAELTAERERYRRIFAKSNDAIFVVDPDADEILDCNARAHEMLDYEADELVGGPISMVHPDEMDRFHAFAQEVFETGEGWTDELTCLTNSGERLPTIMGASTIEWEDRTAMLACAQDISEQKHREQALERLQQIARQLLEARSREESAEFVVDAVEDVLDTPYGTVWFRRSNGDSEREVTERSTQTRQTPKTEFEPVATTDAAAESGLSAVDDIDAFLTDAVDRADGDLEVAATDDFDTPLGCVLVTPLADHGVLTVGLTEESPSAADRRFVETLAANLTAALERADRERDLERTTERLAILNRIVRHDIRNDATLLTTELQQARAAATDDAPEAATDHIDRALDDADHVVELTDTVGDLVEVVTGDATPDGDPINLGRMLQTQVDRASTAHPEASFELSVEASPTVSASEMLSSVFRNLLHNAVDHNDGDSPQVDVEITATDDTAVVRVADDGPGIPPHQREDVFGRGEQGLESSGVGLGLYLVDRLVGRYGGDVEIEDSNLSGVAFRVELPRADR